MLTSLDRLASEKDPETGDTLAEMWERQEVGTDDVLDQVILFVAETAYWGDIITWEMFTRKMLENARDRNKELRGEAEANQ